MAERLGEIEARIASVGQLSAVIGAMRGIAAARLHEATARLAGVRAYAGTVGAAIAQALALVPAPQAAPGGAPAERRIVLALGSEQGFVGAFNARVLDAAQRLLDETGEGEAELLVVGNRGHGVADERAMGPAWAAPMAAHVEEATALANRIADTLFDRLAEGGEAEVHVVHALPSDGGEPGQVALHRLLPFDFSRFPAANRALPPLVQLPAPVLLARLADEYVFAELCEAVVMSFAAENEARMLAMVAAKDNVARKLDELTARARQLRQEQITEEVVELAAGAQAQR